jgi:hypothetical protein
MHHDVLILADEADWQQLLNYISAEHGGLFKLSQHGPCTTINGIEIITDEQNPHKISMNQNTYTRLLSKRSVRNSTFIAFLKEKIYQTISRKHL